VKTRWLSSIFAVHRAPGGGRKRQKSDTQGIRCSLAEHLAGTRSGAQEHRLWVSALDAPSIETQAGRFVTTLAALACPNGPPSGLRGRTTSRVPSSSTRRTSSSTPRRRERTNEWIYFILPDDTNDGPPANRKKGTTGREVRSESSTETRRRSTGGGRERGDTDLPSGTTSTCCGRQRPSRRPTASRREREQPLTHLFWRDLPGPVP